MNNILLLGRVGRVCFSLGAADQLSSAGKVLPFFTKTLFGSSRAWNEFQVVVSRVI